MSTHEPDKAEIKFERAEDVIMLREYERARALQEATEGEARRYREREHQAELDREKVKAWEESQLRVVAASKESSAAFEKMVTASWLPVTIVLVAAAVLIHAMVILGRSALQEGTVIGTTSETIQPVAREGGLEGARKEMLTILDRKLTDSYRMADIFARQDKTFSASLSKANIDSEYAILRRRIQGARTVHDLNGMVESIERLMNLAVARR